MSRILEEALTFDDVLLVPAYSEILPRDVSLTTQFTRDLQIHAPLISAAMDTVTERKLAIAIAHQWGIGAIHKNMSIEDQAEHVRRVKRYENGTIMHPTTIHEDATLWDFRKIMFTHNISGIPVINNNNKLVGIVTKRDIRFETDDSKPLKKIMTTKVVTAPTWISINEAKIILQKHRIEKLPIINKNNEITGLITYKDIMQTANYPQASKDTQGRLLVGAAVGVWWDVFDRLEALSAAQVDVLFVDTAHGHSAGVLKTIKEIKKRYSHIQVVWGNVATGEGALALVDAGVDAVKVGIGPGSICTTRIVAGIGMPQLSAIMNASIALKWTGVPVIADGGIRYSGDITKALAAGANTIMAGSLFAGVEEAPGETIIFQWRKFKTYRGMGSLGAMKKWSKDRYFQEKEDNNKKLVPEGIEGRVPYRGKLSEVVHQYLWGLRAGMWYCWAPDITTLQKASFVKITSASMKESHPHDITITKEAPNYSK